MALPTIGLAAIMDVKDFAKGEKVYTSGLSDMNTKTESTAKRITRALGSITKVALGVGVAAGGALVGLGGMFLKLAADAAPVPAIAQSFVALGGSIEAMRKGSLGLVTDVELMKSFNVAASLVSKDFAQKLPDAMQALSKVSASTGQDLAFLQNSLITGIGRLSPMILDNLAIQVDLNSAYEDFAKANGTTVKAMTKTQQQTALMSQVMEKLNANTADLPDIAGNASTQLGSLSVMFKNLKTDVGVAFLPVLQELLTPLTELAIVVLPEAARFAGVFATALVTKGVPAIREFASAVRTMVQNIQTSVRSIGGRISAGRSWLIDALGLSPEVLSQITTTITGLVARLRAGFADVRRVVLSVFQEFSTGSLRGGFKAALAKMLEVAGTIAEFRQKLIAKLFEVGRTLLTALGDMFPSLKPLIDEFLIPILNIGETVVTTFTKMKTDIRRVLLSMVGLVKEPLAEIGRTFMSVMGNILGIVEKVWPSVLATIQRVVPAALTIISGIMPIVRAVGNVLETVLGDAIPFVLELFAEMAEFIAKAMPQIQRVITKALAVIEIVWTKVWPILQKVVGVAWNTIQKMITTVINVIEGVIDVFLSALEGDWQATWENAKEVLTTWVTDIVKLVAGVVDSIAKALGVENFDITAMVTEWVGIGEDIIEGLLKGVEDTLGGIKGIFEKAIEKLPKWARNILGAESPSRVFAELGIDMMIGLGKGIDEGQAQVIKKLTKAIGRIVNAFAQLLEIQKEFRLSGGQLPDIGNFLDQFESAIVSVLERLDSIIERVGEKRIKKIRESATQLREILDAVMIDLSKIATATLPDLGRWRDQVIDVTRAMLEVLFHLEFEFGTKAIEAAAKWASAAGTILDLVSSGVDALKAMMEFKPLDSFPFLVENFGDRLTEVVNELSLQANTWKIDVSEDAAKLFAAMKQVLDLVRPGVDAITALMEYKPIGRIPFLVENFGDRLAEIVNELSLQAKTWKVDVSEDAEKIFAAMTRVLAVVRPGVDAIVALMEYKPIGKIPFLVENFGDRLTEVVNELSKQAKTWKVDVSEDATALFTAINSIVGIVRPGIDALAAMLEYEPTGSIAAQAANFATRLLEVVDQFGEAAAAVGITLDEDAQTFWAAIQSVVGIVRPGIDSLAALLDFAPVENLAELAAEFGTQIAIMVEQFQEAAEAVGVDLKEDATKFATAAQTIIGLVEPGIKALASLMGFTQVEGIADKAAAFGTDLAIVVRELADVAEEFVVIGEDGSPSGLEAAQRFASAATTIVGVIEPAIKALAALGTLTATENLTGKIALFRRQIGEVLSAIQAIAVGFATGGGPQLIPGVTPEGSGSGLEAAEIFASAVSTISAGIKGAIDLIDGFMAYKGRAIAGGIATFAQNMLQVRRMIVEEASNMAGVVQDALGFESAINVINAAIKAGVDLLAGFPGAEGGALAGIGARIRSALAEVTAAFTSETGIATNAAYNYGYLTGRATQLGFRDGFASIPTPTFSVGSPAGGTGGSDTPPAPPATTVNVNITGTTITSGLDAAAFNAAVEQAVRDGLRRG